MDISYNDVIMSTSAVALSAFQAFANSFYAIDQWTAKVDFEFCEEPVWFLGKCYQPEEFQELRNDFLTRIWCTYRRGFPKIGGNGPQSDQGWGCMLRCGQMVMAEALMRKNLGRDWRWSNDPKPNDEKYRTYLNILKKFLDRRDVPYSIHQIAQMGESEGSIAVGQWFGPNTISQALRKLSEYDRTSNICIYVGLDNVVVIDDLKKQAKRDGPESWSSVVLLIPLRLGLSEINQVYLAQLQKCFQLEETIGIIGGRPNHALYFIGCVGDELIYLDPHKTQPVVDENIDDIINGEVKSFKGDSTYHQEYALRLKMTSLDPSIALCFYFDTEEIFDKWSDNMMNNKVFNCKRSIFEIQKVASNNLSNDHDLSSMAFDEEESSLDVKKDFSSESEDFEILE